MKLDKRIFGLEQFTTATPAYASDVPSPSAAAASETVFTESAPSTFSFVASLEAHSTQIVDPVAQRTTTVIAIVYVPAPPTASSSLTASASISTTSATSSGAALNEYASGQEYSGYTFTGLATVAFSLVLTLVVLSTAFACVLSQAHKMEKLIKEGQDDPELELIDSRRPVSNHSVMSDEMEATSGELDLKVGPDPEEEPPSTESETGSMAAEAESTSDSAASTTIFKVQATPTSEGDGSQSTSAGGGEPTKTSEAVWETQTTGAMQLANDGFTTLLLPISNGLTFACPNKQDEWKDETLGTELQAKVANGAGCYVEYTFKGDTVQIYGATGTEAGIFGCFVTAPSQNSTGWWDAGGLANTFEPYQGSCSIGGLGYGDHTVRLVNSPTDPKKVYFTGLRYTANKTETPWAARSWSGCCAEATWPGDEAPSVEIGSSSSPSSNNSTTSGAVVAGMSNGTSAFLVIALIVIVSIAGIFVGVMCCKKRPASASESSPSLRLRSVLGDRPRDRDDRRRGRSKESRQSDATLRRRKGRKDPSTTDSDGNDTDTSTASSSKTSTGSATSEDRDTDRDEKRRKRTR
ncbi:hypothetical protein JCM10212_005966 [Sporobolomyces blumeae]